MRKQTAACASQTQADVAIAFAIVVSSEMKRRKLRFTCVLTFLVVVSGESLFGWNAAGHRSITFLAYTLLSPRARARVDAIIKAHPDFQTVFAAGTATDPGIVHWVCDSPVGTGLSCGSMEYLTRKRSYVTIRASVAAD